MDAIINSALNKDIPTPFPSTFDEDDKKVLDKKMEEILVKITLYKCKFCLFFCSIPSGIFTHCQSIHPQKVNITLEKEEPITQQATTTVNSKDTLKDLDNLNSDGISCNEDLEKLPPISSSKSTSCTSFEHDYSKWLDQNYDCGQQFPSKETDEENDGLVYNEEITNTISTDMIKKEGESEPQGNEEEEPSSANNEDSNNTYADGLEPKKLYLCSDCNILFPSLDACSEHLVKLHDFQQSLLIDRNKTKSSIPSKKHRKNSPKKSRGPIDCDSCGKTFASAWTLRNHKNHVHSQLRKHKCKQCDYTAARAEMVKLHMRRHTGEKPFLCDSCPFNTADPNSLRRHKMIHAGRKPFNCNYCPYSVKKAAALLAHLKMRHPGMGQIYKCESCTFETVSKLTFQRHICKNPDQTQDQEDAMDVKMEGSQPQAAKSSLLQNIHDAYLAIKQKIESSVNDHETLASGNRTHALVKIDGLDQPVTVDLGTCSVKTV